MGHVWRARDGKLGRDVAIKILPDEFTGDDERLRRFEREAKLLASLNHPHIAQIFGVEQVDSTCFLVLELVGGETLAARLAREGGGLPVAEALEILRQVAEGLEAAHEAGIVHRDLKPANVALTEEGEVKLLDFGLAKATGKDPASGPTVVLQGDSVSLSREGVVMGTPTYMSPEQARGRKTDKRTDIWAFGCLLFECLTGAKAFGGETVTDVLGAIVHKEPDWERLPPTTPPRARDLLRRCLAKDPRLRLRDIGEARVSLAEAIADPSSSVLVASGLFAGAAGAAGAAGSAGAEAGSRPTARWRKGWIAALAVVAFAVGLKVGERVLEPGVSSPAASAPAVAFEFDVPGLVVRNGMMAISPDGTQLVFQVATADGDSELWLRSLADFNGRPLPGTRGAKHPFWSPDGKELGFFAGHELKRVAIAGTSPRTVANVGMAYGGSWSADGTILYGTESGPLFKVSAGGGGKPVPVTELVDGLEDTHAWPTFLPDGRHFVYMSDASTDEGHRICVGSLDGGPPIVLLTGIRAQPFVDPRGALLLSQGGQLVAYPFDVASGALRGEAQLVADDVYARGTIHESPVAVSEAGVLAFQHGSSLIECLQVDLTGQVLRSLAPADDYSDPALSPDGRSVALELSQSAGERTVSVLDIDRGVRTILSQRGLLADSPVWSPDGRTLYFDQNVKPSWTFWRRPADGREPAEELGTPEGCSDAWTLDISRDGRQLLGASTRDGRWALFWRDLEAPPGDKAAWQPAAVAAETEYARLSPDGRWIAYTTDSSGELEVYVAPIEGGPQAQLLQVSSGGGREPRWSPDGGTLYYRSPRDVLMAAPVSAAGDRLSAGASKALFDLGLAQPGTVRNTFDLFPDGQSLVLLRTQRSATTTVYVRTGWRAF